MKTISDIENKEPAALAKAWLVRRHRRVGHLFHGRYKAILVDKDSFLLELSRYAQTSKIHQHPSAHASLRTLIFPSVGLCSLVLGESRLGLKIPRTERDVPVRVRLRAPTVFIVAH